MTAKYFVTQSTSGKWFLCETGDASCEPLQIFANRMDAIDVCLKANKEPDPTTQEPKRKVGRPAKYASNVERQAAYNQRKRDQQAQDEAERQGRIKKREDAARGAQMYAACKLAEILKTYEVNENKGYVQQIIDQLQKGQVKITVDQT